MIENNINLIKIGYIYKVALINGKTFAALCYHEDLNWLHFKNRAGFCSVVNKSAIVELICIGLPYSDKRVMVQ